MNGADTSTQAAPKPKSVLTLCRKCGVEMRRSWKGKHYLFFALVLFAEGAVASLQHTVAVWVGGIIVLVGVYMLSRMSRIWVCPNCGHEKS